MESILIKGASVVVTQDRERRILRDFDILIEDHRISSIARDISATADVVLEAKGKLVMPGLINTHTHIPMNLFRGVADDMGLMEWLEKKIWPMERKLNPYHIRAGALLGMLESLKMGTTTIFDMYFFEGTIAEAASKIGIRAVLASSVLEFPTPETRSAEEALSIAENFIKEWKGRDPLVTPSIGPHAPYSVTPENLIRAKEIAVDENVPLQIHLAEDYSEVEQMRKKYGKPSIKHADDLGLFDARTVAAHVVWPSSEELEILRKRGILVSHNPVSNMKTAAGFSPIPDYLKNGIRVGLGTDGAASNNVLDMFETMKFAALIHKGYMRDPTVVNVRQVLDMVTRTPAEFLGIKLGAIEPGSMADVVILDIKKPWWIPLHSPESHLVYSARSSDVAHVIVNGKLVIENGELTTLDEGQIMKDAVKASLDLLERSGVKSFLSNKL